MAVEFDYTIADRDFYAPADAADPGTRYQPSDALPDWTSERSGLWTVWSPPGAVLAEAGWKVHVSASWRDAQPVLDIVARRCAQHGLVFKHLSGHRYFALMHGKHSSRAQSGKFCAIYPKDVPEAETLMAELEHDLSDFAGTYVLTDRRFGQSQCVSYRFGAFVARTKLEVDGTHSYLLRTEDGRELPDERLTRFVLPAGVEDPFLRRDPTEADGDPTINGYTFDEVLRHANGGGAYRATSPAGDTVFVKEARAHNGYTYDVDSQQRLATEYATLQLLAEKDPGLAPAPVELFRSWEHDFLVTEFVAGQSLRSWMTARTPIIAPEADGAEIGRYLDDCLGLLDQVSDALERLHRLGYAFVDVSPDNVLVDGSRVRLIDFEATQRVDEPLRMLFTPNFVPPQVLTSPDYRAAVSPLAIDDYGLSALAQLLVFPLHPVCERNPNALEHLAADLRRRADIPPRLWSLVQRNHPADDNPGTISPARVERDPIGSLRRLAARTGDALVLLARTEADRPIFPTTPAGLRTNHRCIAHGTAGVLHALRYAGRPGDPAWVVRLRDDSLRRRAETPPGLMIGNSGIAWVLAEYGERDAADRLLEHATADALLDECSSWSNGTAGVALAQLAAACRDQEPGRIGVASDLLARPLQDRVRTASGLARGRSGVALAHYYLARIGGDDRHLDTAEQLLRDELAEHRVDLGPNAIGLRVSTSDQRRMPYLYSGSAGFAFVLARYLLVRPDPYWSEILDRCRLALRIRQTVFAGLFQGLSGLVITAGDGARLAADSTGDPAADGPLRDLELAAARALFQHAIPHPSGVRWLGDQGQRYSADLWSGSAGVLLTLHHLLHRTPDPLFTLDAYVGPISAPAQRRADHRKEVYP